MESLSLRFLPSLSLVLRHSEADAGLGGDVGGIAGIVAQLAAESTNSTLLRPGIRRVPFRSHQRSRRSQPANVNSRKRCTEAGAAPRRHSLIR